MQESEEQKVEIENVKMKEDSNEKSKKKNDIILIVSLLAVVLVVGVVMFLMSRSKTQGPETDQVVDWIDGAETDQVVVWIDGAEYARYELSVNQTVKLPGVLGHNTLTIEDGKVWMSDAVCPDKTCMLMGKISTQYPMPIVCLPGKIIVTIESKDNASIDTIGQ